MSTLKKFEVRVYESRTCYYAIEAEDVDAALDAVEFSEPTFVKIHDRDCEATESEA